MKLQKAVTLIAIVAISGCATEAQRKDEEINLWKQTLPAPNADYGSYPTNYENIIKANLASSLKDPDSARYGAFSKPRKEHIITNAPLKEANYGYSVCVPVNAKNSYGGYTGNHLFWFFIRNGNVIRSQDVDSSPLGRTIYIGKAINCQDGEAP
jgi:hypothetical protein